LKTASSGRFDALTGARWLFASLVFVYHNRKYWRNDVNKYLMQFMNEMHIGVSLFFVLSGFLIAFKYNKPGTGKHHYGRYAGLRMARILPLYWLLLLVSYIDWGFPKTGYQTFITFSLLHGFSNVHNLDGIAQAWSLTVEMSFYALAPLIFFCWNKAVWKAIALLIAMFLLVYGAGEALHSFNGNKGQYFYPFHFVVHSTFFGRATEFIFGVWLASMLHGQHLNLFKKIRHKTVIGFSGAFISLFLISFLQPDIFHHGYDTVMGSLIQYIIVPFFAIIWFYGLIEERTWMQQLFSSKLFVLLGNASFAFYMVHISYVNLRIKGLFFLTDRNYVVLWLASILLYLFFEKPVNDFFRKLLLKNNRQG
jgi:peptidoglycan/LPS O-acetylase OafA/YrhL